MTKLQIAVLAGDGIGLEVTEAVLPIFAVLNLPIELHFGRIGWSCWQESGFPIPKQTWELIHQSDATLVGAVTSKPAREAVEELNPKLDKTKYKYLSPIIQLRQELGLFANVRPCFNIRLGVKPFHCCVIRENIEGLYAGFDFHPPPLDLMTVINEHENWQAIKPIDLSCTLRVQSRAGLQRLFKFAFNYAQSRNLARVSFADKPNILRESSAFAREIFEIEAKAHPLIVADILNVDAIALGLIKRPEEFGVIVAENMFGDILSDIGAASMGGLGFAHSVTIGQKGCYFEPAHGSGLQMRSTTANPCAMFLTIGLLLRHFSYYNQAEVIKKAVIETVQIGKNTTYDLGGHSSTIEMATAIIEKVRKDLRLKSM